MAKTGEMELNMASFIVAVILLIIVGTAIAYIVKEKKKGTVCIGCPHAGTCAERKSQDSQCGCH